jgi:hypothetical protein
MNLQEAARMAWISGIVSALLGFLAGTKVKKPLNTTNWSSENLPVSDKHIDMVAIRRILKQSCPGAEVFLSDKSYLACSRADIEAFLDQDKTNKHQYVVEEYDCDDFSYRLMGQFAVEGWARLAFGIVWTDRHALNCFITENGEFRLIEPQTDKIQKGLEDWQGSEWRFVTM